MIKEKGESVMWEKVQNIFIMLFVAFAVIYTGFLIWRFLRGKYGPIKTVKAKVVSKYKLDTQTKIYGSLAKPAGYAVVFSINGKTRRFLVSEFSYNGYRKGETGTLRYRGDRIVSFE